MSNIILEICNYGLVAVGGGVGVKLIDMYLERKALHNKAMKINADVRCIWILENERHEHSKRLTAMIERNESEILILKQKSIVMEIVRRLDEAGRKLNTDKDDFSEKKKSLSKPVPLPDFKKKSLLNSLTVTILPHRLNDFFICCYPLLFFKLDKLLWEIIDSKFIFS